MNICSKSQFWSATESKDDLNQQNGASLIRHEIFPEFSGIPEFSQPQRSFSWKSQIRFNIYGGGVP